MYKEKLSIIIPCFNVENYIEECVNSIISQKVRDIEIILIDDASTDNTFNICESIKSKYSFIKLIHHQNNCGQEKTRNDGLEIARGEWILFVDGDDVIEAEILKTLLNEASENIDIVISRLKYFDAQTSHCASCELESGKVYSSSEIASKTGKDLSWDMISCMGNKLYNREFLKKNELKFDIKFKYNEDGGFAMMALAKAKYIKYLDIVTYCYRQNFAGTMNSYKNNAFITLNEVNNLIKDFFEINNCGKEQWFFLNKKIIGNLISSINSEIQCGSKDSFYSQMNIIRSDGDILNQICEILDDNSYSSYEKMYVKAVKDGLFDFIYENAKKDALTKIYKQWVYAYANGRCATDVLKEKNVRSIAIYGAGEVGRLIASDAKKAGLNVDYFLDVKEKNNLNDDIACYNPNDFIIPETDIIVNTVLIWNRDVSDFISKKTNIPVISIWKLLV